MSFDEQVVAVFGKEKGLSVKTKELKNEDREWKEVEKIFRKTMDVEVKPLYWIENKWLLESLFTTREETFFKKLR